MDACPAHRRGWSRVLADQAARLPDRAPPGFGLMVVIGLMLALDMGRAHSGGWNRSKAPSSPLPLAGRKKTYSSTYWKLSVTEVDSCPGSTLVRLGAAAKSARAIIGIGIGRGNSPVSEMERRRTDLYPACCA